MTKLLMFSASVLLCIGCASFQAHSKETGCVVDLGPASPGNAIPVYWRNAASLQPARPVMPDRDFAVLGYVTGEAHLLAQGLRFEFVEAYFRKGAVLLGGDAVIDAHRTHFFGPAPVTAFQGTVVKWAEEPGKAELSQ